MDIQNNQEPQRVIRVESFEIEKEKPLNNELATEKKEVVPSVVVTPIEEVASVKYLSLSQVCCCFHQSYHCSLVLH